MNTWEFTVNTGNAEIDRQTIENYRQQVAAQGVQLQITPMPGGGLHVRCIPPGAAGAAPQQAAGGWPQQQSNPQQAAWGQQQSNPQQAAWGQQQSNPQQAAWGAQASQQSSAGAWGGGAAAFSAAGGGAAAAVANPAASAAAGIAPPLSLDRVKYLRKVYGLLFGSALVAIVAGGVMLNIGEPVAVTYLPTGQTMQAPWIVGLVYENPAILGILFGALFVSTFIASWLSKVKVLNVIMLFLVGALIGADMAPMIAWAGVKAGFGLTATANPARDAGLMVLATFTGITGYVFVTRKDFSYLRGILSMGVAVIFVACLLTFVFQSEMFTIAVASVGALLSAGIILWVTSAIFRDSEMDDPVGDALVLLVQLRNLFMFLLRIFMSSRD